MRKTGSFVLNYYFKEIREVTWHTAIVLLFNHCLISRLFYISVVLFRFVLFLLTFDTFSGTHVRTCVQVATPLQTPGSVCGGHGHVVYGELRMFSCLCQTFNAVYYFLYFLYIEWMNANNMCSTNIVIIADGRRQTDISTHQCRAVIWTRQKEATRSCQSWTCVYCSRAFQTSWLVICQTGNITVVSISVKSASLALGINSISLTRLWVCPNINVQDVLTFT